MNAIEIVSLIFSALSFVLSLLTISVIIGWKYSTHKVYTKFVQGDGKPLDVNKQFEKYNEELDLDSL